MSKKISAYGIQLSHQQGVCAQLFRTFEEAQRKLSFASDLLAEEGRVVRVSIEILDD